MNFLDDEYNTDVQKELEPENSKRKVIENVDGNLGLIKLAALDKLPDYSEDDWDDWDDECCFELGSICVDHVRMIKEEKEKEEEGKKTKKGYCNNRKK